MIPLVGTVREFTDLAARVRAIASEVEAKTGGKVAYLVGTMIEVPRACLVAEEIAKEAEFFSFGTNDLTQMTYGFSRDDIGKFLPEYLTQRILPFDPFQSIDQDGVGKLVTLSVAATRSRWNSSTAAGSTTCRVPPTACPWRGWPRPTRCSTKRGERGREQGSVPNRRGSTPPTARYPGRRRLRAPAAP
jgi:phosphoenolpyruvate synthase/pyruvate phosphate dikinase